MPKQNVPLELINFVAKTGFITKELWRKYFFKNKDGRWMYQSWKNLELRGYFIPHPYPIINDVLVLNTKNPKLKALIYGKPVKHVFPTYIMHDSELYNGLLDVEEKKLIQNWETEPQMKSRLGIEFGYRGYEDQKVKFPDALVENSVIDIKKSWEDLNIDSIGKIRSTIGAMSSDPEIQSYLQEVTRELPKGLKIHRDTAEGFILLAYSESKSTYRAPHNHGNAWVIYAVVSKCRWEATSTLLAPMKRID